MVEFLYLKGEIMRFLKLLNNEHFLLVIFALCWAYGWLDFLAGPVVQQDFHHLAWPVIIIASVPMSLALYFLPAIIVFAALLLIADIVNFVVELIRR